MEQDKFDAQSGASPRDLEAELMEAFEFFMRHGRRTRRNKMKRGPLRLGADIDALDVEGFSLLARCAKSGDFDACRWLLEAGADPDGGAESNVVPLGAFLGNEESAPGSCSKWVELFCSAGADPNAQDDIGLAPLHYVARRAVWSSAVPHMALAYEALLEAGADPGLFSASGYLPIDYARGLMIPNRTEWPERVAALEDRHALKRLTAPATPKPASARARAL